MYYFCIGAACAIPFALPSNALDGGMSTASVFLLPVIAAALFAVNIAGLATGIQLSVNRWSLGAGALLGVPGVISMLVLNIVFK